MGLLKVEKNELLIAISANGLNPLECRLEDRRRTRFSFNSTTFITHLPSGSCLEVTPINDIYYEYGISGNKFPRPIKWVDIIDVARKWAGEIAQPDFWADLMAYQDLFAGTTYSDLGNALFTTSERKAIADELEKIKEYVRKTYDLSDEKMSRIEDRLNEVAKATHRIGRKDWLLLFTGTIFTLLVTDLVAPEVVQHIFMMALHALTSLFEEGVRRIESDPTR